MTDELLKVAERVCDEAERFCDNQKLMKSLHELRDELKKARGASSKAKKTVVINLGDIRDGDWETKSVLGLDLMGKIRDAGFEPSTYAPYVDESMDWDWYSLGLGEDGDVPLLITVELEDDEKFKGNVELIESIVGDSVDVLGDDEEEGDDGELERAFEQEAMMFEGEDDEEDEDEDD